VHRLARAAKVIAFSHGVHDVPGMLSNRRGLIVRLGHGLTAFKQTRPRTERTLDRMTRRVDLVPVASEFERANKATWGFDSEKLVVTGLARWDLMQAARNEAHTSDRVLFALTGRDWIGPRSLEGTEYWSVMRSLADAHWLRPLLEPEGLSIELFLHPLIRDALEVELRALDPRPRLLTRGGHLPAALTRAALVVTDYSSVAWDALYLGIPVLFFHFDVDEYLAHRDSFVDLRSRLFGPATRSVDGLREGIEAFIANGRSFPGWEEDQRRWSDIAFAYRDAENAARVVAEIDTALTRART
jgi:hypothetical protein